MESFLQDYGCTFSKKDINGMLNKTLNAAFWVLEKISEPNTDKWPMQLFLMCTIFCFLASSAMHLFWVRSVHVCNLTHNIDLSGISLMIFGSCMAIIHYTFNCNPFIYRCYVVGHTLTMLGILAYINIKSFKAMFGNFHHLGTALFVTQAAFASLAVIHWRWMK